MIKTKDKKQSVPYTEITALKCDSCGENIFGKKPDDTIVHYSSLTLTRCTIGSIKDGGGEYLEHEKTDLCRRCYNECLTFVRKNGAICPSFYENNKPSEDEGDPGVQ